MKQVWLRENTKKEESHKLNKEAKAEIDYLNLAWDKQPFEDKKGRQ